MVAAIGSVGFILSCSTHVVEHNATILNSYIKVRTALPDLYYFVLEENGSRYLKVVSWDEYVLYGVSDPYNYTETIYSLPSVDQGLNILSIIVGGEHN